MGSRRPDQLGELTEVAGAGVGGGGRRPPCFSVSGCLGGGGGEGRGGLVNLGILIALSHVWASLFGSPVWLPRWRSRRRRSGCLALSLLVPVGHTYDSTSSIAPRQFSPRRADGTYAHARQRS